MNGIERSCRKKSHDLCSSYQQMENHSSVNQMALLTSKDALLATMFKPYKLAQYTLSRFFTTSFAWRTFGHKRAARLQEVSVTALKPGDVINLDDTLIAHPYAKKLPFLCWLFDSLSKTYRWCMNLVVLQERASDLER